MDISQEELSKIIGQAVATATAEVSKQKETDEVTEDYLKKLEDDVEYLGLLLDETRENKYKVECERDAALDILKSIHQRYGLLKNGEGKLYHPELIREIPIYVPYPVKETAVPLIRFIDDEK